MLKFCGRIASGHILGLGLTRENVTRLTQGQAIHVLCAEISGLPWPGEILIYFGEEEKDVKKVIEGFIGPNTVRESRTGNG